jgi:N6-adenosine-specific RNA methylase IME4
VNRADAEEYTEALGQVVAGGWRQVALGRKLGVPDALGISTSEWVEGRLGGYVRLSIEERRTAVEELTAPEANGGHGLSQRQAAEVLGVDQATVNRDRDANASPAPEPAPAQQRRRHAADANASPALPATAFPTVVADPPWRYDNKATRNAAEFHYPTMTLEELRAIEPPAAADAHLYLWATVGFLREAFELVDAWGFAYKTTLTWCKPQIGLGNYFRVSTEHVLFGVRGRLPLERKDVPTWFVADRQHHSQKPESFYDLVERVSPGPYLDMFARRARPAWTVWGDEA